ncbi:uncharacterized protein DEA37_0007822 [Paragonimus westermani]|uniref:Uncharacterized protein n=1 Tax=Paragonimus westermani TaxID=34504 RepID=A0A5J4NBM0_9TREM|nr:uncharacterized protein DEA37_0007822 [Paragonimus westermani]
MPFIRYVSQISRMFNVNNEAEKVFLCNFGGSRSVSEASGVEQLKKAMEFILRDSSIVQWPSACVHVSPSSVRIVSFTPAYPSTY